LDEASGVNGNLGRSPVEAEDEMEENWVKDEI